MFNIKGITCIFIKKTFVSQDFFDTLILMSEGNSPQENIYHMQARMTHYSNSELGSCSYKIAAC